MVFKSSGDNSDSNTELQNTSGQNKSFKATRVDQVLKRKVKKVTRGTLSAAKSAEEKGNRSSTAKRTTTIP